MKMHTTKTALFARSAGGTRLLHMGSRRGPLWQHAAQALWHTLIKSSLVLLAPLQGDSVACLWPNSKQRTRRLDRATKI